MSNVINSNCRKCPYFISKRCSGDDGACICKYCPRNIKMCITVKWCRETESPIVFEE